MTKQFTDFIVRNTLTINDFLEKSLEQRVENSQIREILKYSVLADGKRIRPLLFLATVVELGHEISDEHLKIAGGIELIHTYSLIHDDLPAMDNDDFRRGLPTSHKKFGEANAILAGDGLLTLGLNWIAQAKIAPEISQKIMQIITNASGINGMVEGQFLDIMATNQAVDDELIAELEYKKTAELIVGAVTMGTMVGQASDLAQQKLISFAQKFGTAFQVYDDLVDVKESKQTAGKQTDKDAANGKNNYVTRYGVKAAEDHLKELINSMKTDLQTFDSGILVGFTNVFEKVLVNE